MKHPHRKTTRLQYYDYASQGIYRVTICAHDHANLFGTIDHGNVILSGAGLVIDEELQALPQRYASVHVDKYVIMPNHIHVLLSIMDSQEDHKSPPPTLGQIIGALKPVQPGVLVDLSGNQGFMNISSGKSVITLRRLNTSV